MIDNRLARADATKLDELHEIMMAQENSERLCDIGMKKINIGHGAAAGICDAVKALTDGKKVLMVTGPTEILDTAGANVKEKILALLKAEYEVEWLVISEPDSVGFVYVVVYE